uniref:Ig-like domain-containing protein n=1 Tax=Erpetoichthys calabaricus TaxID=27687 RepID=A0A8C4REJ4_ERPCA
MSPLLRPLLCTFKLQILYNCFLGLISHFLKKIVLKQPGALQAKPGESVQLKCAVEGFTPSSYWMAWIRQAPGKSLEWLIYYASPGNEYYNSGIKGRFIPSKDSANFYMQMNDLRADDTAVYYCARDTASETNYKAAQEHSGLHNSVTTHT